MGTFNRNVKVGDDLSGVTLNFDFSNVTPPQLDDFCTKEIIHVDNQHKISLHNSRQETIFGTLQYQVLVVYDGSSSHTICKVLPGASEVTGSSSVTLSSNFGTVQSVDINCETSGQTQVAKEFYEAISIQINAKIKLNNTNISNLRVNNTQINKIYLNDERVY